MAITKEHINELLESGWIRCLITFEVAGRPKEHVEKTLDSIMEDLEKQKPVEVIKANRHEAHELEGEDGFFSAFAEVELLAKQLETLTSLSVSMTPASIEVLEPDAFQFPANKLQNWLNDVLSQLHGIAQTLRGERQKANYLSLNMKHLVRNLITVLLAGAPRDDETLSRLSGIKSDELSRILSEMESEDIIKKEADKWTLTSSEK